jgi:hypothetical protein
VSAWGFAVALVFFVWLLDRRADKIEEKLDEIRGMLDDRRP